MTFSSCRRLVFTDATGNEGDARCQASLRAANKNHILAALPRADYKRIAPHLEHVKLSGGQILYDVGARIKYVYFPTNSIISHVSQTPEGAGIEVGVTGFEGMTDIPPVLGVNTSPHETMVQIHDGAMRMSARSLMEEFKQLLSSNSD